MGFGGEGASRGGTVKKSKTGTDDVSKSQMNRKHKRKERRKGRKSSKLRSKSSSKNPTGSKTFHKSRKPSTTPGNESSASDGYSSRDEKSVIHNSCIDVASLVKPEKLEKASMTMRSDCDCCTCTNNRSVVIPSACNKLLPVEEETKKNTTEYQGTLCIALLSKERDYYKAEFQKLLKFFEKSNNSKEGQEGNRQQCKACDKKDTMIEYLQRENQVLAKEKHFLMARLESGGTRLDIQSPAGICQKLPCKRVERERDLLKFDVRRLEEENDCLREKIKVSNEVKTSEYVKFQEQRIEYENIISKLDGERRELIKAEGIGRISIIALEEKMQTYSDLLRVEQHENERMKNQYYQLKKLHDQCDKALLDTQVQLMEVERELLIFRKKSTNEFKEQVHKKYPSIDRTLENGNKMFYPSEDIQWKMKNLEQEKYGLPKKSSNEFKAQVPTKYTGVDRTFETGNKMFHPSEDNQWKMMNLEQEKSGLSKKSTNEFKAQVPNKYPSVDRTIENGNKMFYPSEDGQWTMKNSEQEKSGLRNALNRKTEEFEISGGTKDETSRLEQNATLKNELREMENQVILWKEKYKNIEMVVEEKKVEIEKLKKENSEKLTEMEKMQNNWEEKESTSRVLQAEVEHLNKESNALVTKNHQQQGDIQQLKVQISVAIETINELENKVKQLEETILDYEEQIKILKSDLSKYESQATKKDRDIDQLLNHKLSLEKTKDELDAETEEHKRRICELECQCHKLQTILMDMNSKEKLISDLNFQLTKLKAEKEVLDKQNAEMAKRATKMENKLKCICTICDNAEDKCSMLKCFLKEQATLTARGGTFVNVMVSGAGTRDVATQVCNCSSRSRNPKLSMNSTPKVMIPQDEVITTSVTLEDVEPISSVENDRYNDDPINFPYYRAASLPNQHLENVDDQNIQKIPLNIENEENKMRNSFPKFQWSYFNSFPNYGSEVGREFIMDHAPLAYKSTQTENYEKFTLNQS